MAPLLTAILLSHAAWAQDPWDLRRGLMYVQEASSAEILFMEPATPAIRTTLEALAANSPRLRMSLQSPPAEGACVVAVNTDQRNGWRLIGSGSCGFDTTSADWARTGGPRVSLRLGLGGAVGQYRLGAPHGGDCATCEPQTVASPVGAFAVQVGGAAAWGWIGVESQPNFTVRTAWDVHEQPVLFATLGGEGQLGPTTLGLEIGWRPRILFAATRLGVPFAQADRYSHSVELRPGTFIGNSAHQVALAYRLTWHAITQ